MLTDQYKEEYLTLLNRNPDWMKREIGRTPFGKTPKTAETTDPRKSANLFCAPIVNVDIERALSHLDMILTPDVND